MRGRILDGVRRFAVLIERWAESKGREMLSS